MSYSYFYMFSIYLSISLLFYIYCYFSREVGFLVWVKKNENKYFDVIFFNLYK